MMKALVSRRPERAPRVPAVPCLLYLMPELRTACAGLLIFGSLAFAGCESKPATQLVEGNVTYSGKPLDHGMLSFLPSTGKLVGAPIRPDGRYSIELAPGDYTVSVNAPPKLPEGFQEGDPLPPPDPNALPAKYNRKETSGLSVTVESGTGPQTFDVTLQ